MSTDSEALLRTVRKWLPHPTGTIADPGRENPHDALDALASELDAAVRRTEEAERERDAAREWVSRIWATAEQETWDERNGPDAWARDLKRGYSERAEAAETARDDAIAALVSERVERRKVERERDGYAISIAEYAEVSGVLIADLKETPPSSETLEAELERVKAERDGERTRAKWLQAVVEEAEQAEDAVEEYRENVEARLDTALAALRVALDCKGSYSGTVSQLGGEPALCTKCEAIARAALAEIEGEA